MITESKETGSILIDITKGSEALGSHGSEKTQSNNTTGDLEKVEPVK